MKFERILQDTIIINMKGEGICCIGISGNLINFRMPKAYENKPPQTLEVANIAAL